MKLKTIQSMFVATFAMICMMAFTPNNVKAENGWTEAIIIAQPTDVVECENSLDQFLFVVAAPLDREYKIVYRWWKDGEPYSDWVEDFGQITFDTLRYSMSGTYFAEIFAFDPNYTEEEDEDYEGTKFNPGGVGNGEEYSYEDARVSPIVFSEPANLYVLQKPEFMFPIPNEFVNLGDDIVLTFDAHTYGEHNMEDPSYWTQIQWFNDTVPLMDDARYEGTKASILTINDIKSTDIGTKYRVRLIGECDTTWSNYFSINEEPQANITVQPIDASGCINDVVQLSVEATSSNAGVNLQYQWWVDGAMIMDEAGKFNGTNTPDLNVTLDPALGYDGTEEFVCQVWPQGYMGNSTMSDPAMITWKMAPMIMTDLMANYSAAEGDNLDMFVMVTGENLTYTWTKDGADLGVNNDSLSLTDLATSDAGEYVVTITNECGEATSATANVEVTQGPVVLTNVPLQDRLGLHQNYPNPFTSVSTISWNLQSGGYATMEITDMLGNKVATVFEKNLNSGFDKVSLNTSELNLASGSYYLTLRTNNLIQTKQITIVR